LELSEATARPFVCFSYAFGELTKKQHNEKTFLLMTTRAPQLQWAPKGPLGWEVGLEGDWLGGETVLGTIYYKKAAKSNNENCGMCE